MDAKAYWVGFNTIKGIGAVRMQALLDYFGDLEVAWHAPYDALCAAGLTEKIAQNVIVYRRHVDLEKLLCKILAQGIKVIIREDAEYPRRLREIAYPPPVLYVRGEIDPRDDWAVAVVGTRNASSYGRQVAAEVGKHLARNGITVVSGLARGIDRIAHESALDAGGRSLAVLGSGVDRIYPPEHRFLANQMIQTGALISDYPPGTPPESINFPPRNRIISGLSVAVVIVEAGKESGALITAEFAAEQGREVFAVPGNIFNPQSAGTNYLIQQGAKPMLKVEDILEELNLQQVVHTAALPLLPSDEVESSLFRLLSKEPLHIDDIRAQSGLPIERVSATLAMMELKGIIRQVGYMSYVLC
ncbi:MAG: DNA-protecting protein DprA [Anaerolineae bacterium]|nr:DNA-protecting protein DprA [Anaerolineae bacterium]